MGETVQYKTPNGGSVSGYLATAAGSTKHVVVIQEWWGLNDQIRGVCDRFAAAGFNALAPDLYQGRVTAGSKRHSKRPGRAMNYSVMRRSTAFSMSSAPRSTTPRRANRPVSVRAAF